MNRRIFLKSFFSILIFSGFSKNAIADFAALKVPQRIHDDHIRDYLYKMRHFNDSHKNDIYLDIGHLPVFRSSLHRLKRVQRIVGHGNFCLLNFDEAVKISKSYTRVGGFTKAELDFLEKLFYDDSTEYGFLGEKPLNNISDKVKLNKIVKIHHTGNYLYKGAPLETYKKIKKDLGHMAVLTSGIRSISKQFLLFLSKIEASNANISLASRSLAPPGYSFHGVGDFDMGQINFGAANFTSKFEKSAVYHKLMELGYIKLRYSKDNLLGVRYEPWHIKVVNC